MLPELGSRAYHLAVRWAALLGVEKARKWVAGRASVPAELARISAARKKGQPLIWLHAASLGEFEQGAPVLEMIRERHPGHYLLLSFFSPSGYEARRDHPAADAVIYLAEDRPAAAREWVSTLQPQLAIFVKYEFWPSFLKALHFAGVPVFLIAASFRPSQPFFQWYGSGWRSMLGYFEKLLVQTQKDADLLIETGFGRERIAVTGDPRTDRTVQLAKTPFTDKTLAEFTEGRRCLLAGSVWPADVKVLLDLLPQLPQDWSLIIAPHQLKEHQLEDWAGKFDAARYTRAGAGRQKTAGAKVLLLDTIGILSRAYRYADLAYVGGAFKTGLHNTLEPMAYGLPVIFGPRYAKFPEAVAAVNSGGGFSITNGGELVAVFQRIQTGRVYDTAVAAVQSYMAEAENATGKTYRALEPYLC